MPGPAGSDASVGSLSLPSSLAPQLGIRDQTNDATTQAKVGSAWENELLLKWRTASYRIMALTLAGGACGGAYAALRGVSRPHRYVVAFGVNTGFVSLFCMSTHVALSLAIPDRPRLVAAASGVVGGGLVAGATFGSRSGMKLAVACGVAGLAFNELGDTLAR